MNYTVSVTASNTGGSTTTNATLCELTYYLINGLTTFMYTFNSALDPLTSLEVSCVAGEDGCYLEASCVPSQPGLVSGCRLDYTSSAGSEWRISSQLGASSKIAAAVSCDNQTIGYTGMSL